jgi:hypothetical protein
MGMVAYACNTSYKGSISRQNTDYTAPGQKCETLSEK